MNVERFSYQGFKVLFDNWFPDIYTKNRKKANSLNA